MKGGHKARAKSWIEGLTGLVGAVLRHFVQLPARLICMLTKHGCWGTARSPTDAGVRLRGDVLPPSFQPLEVTCTRRRESLTFDPIVRALVSTPNRHRVTVRNSTYCPQSQSR
jgi:hypothetical protein